MQPTATSTASRGPWCWGRILGFHLWPVRWLYVPLPTDGPPSGTSATSVRWLCTGNPVRHDRFELPVPSGKRSQGSPGTDRVAGMP